MKMKSILKLQLLVVIFLTKAYGQGQFTVTTNKSEYGYGEQITVELKYLNNSDSAFSFWSDPYCITKILFKGTDLDLLCSTAGGVFDYPVGKSQSWIWTIDPKIQGIPVKSGEQVIIGSFVNNLIDSALFSAPQYYGGQIRLSIKNSVAKEELDALKDSINAVVIVDNGCGDYGCEQIWQIEGFSIDSLSMVLNNDYRFNTVETWRPIILDSTIVTDVKDRNRNSMEYLLFQNYPNPFNPKTTIEYSLPTSGHVKIAIYDLLGKEIVSLVDNFQNSGNYKIEFDGSQLTSGVYLYRIQSGKYAETKKLILLK